jgi:hypothetical protein
LQGKNISVLELTPALADDFIYWKYKKGESAATVRLGAAAATLLPDRRRNSPTLDALEAAEVWG